jgi:hypothetical protein
MDKFINAASQIRSGARGPLEAIIKSVAQGGSLENTAPLEQDLNDDLYVVLFDKTDGEAHDIIATCTPGDGKSALFKLQQHFSEISGQALSVRMRALMNPNRAKHVWEVSGLLDKWSKNVHHLEGIAPADAVLPIMFKVQAVINILCGRLSDLHDTVSNHKIRTEPELRSFLARIKEDARKKESEHNAQMNSTPMDTDALNYANQYSSVSTQMQQPYVDMS